MTLRKITLCLFLAAIGLMPQVSQGMLRFTLVSKEPEATFFDSIKKKASSAGSYLGEALYNTGSLALDGAGTIVLSALTYSYFKDHSPEAVCAAIGATTTVWHLVLRGLGFKPTDIRAKLAAGAVTAALATGYINPDGIKQAVSDAFPKR